MPFQNVARAGELTVDDIIGLRGNCGHCSYVGGVQAFDPAYEINKMELVEHGSSWSTQTLGRSFFKHDLYSAFTKFGPNNLQLGEELDYEIHNTVGTYENIFKFVTHLQGKRFLYIVIYNGNLPSLSYIVYYILCNTQLFILFFWFIMGFSIVSIVGKILRPKREIGSEFKSYRYLFIVFS